MQVLSPNPDFDFWNSDPKIHFLTNLESKSQSCLFCLKIVTHGISRMLIHIPTLVFWLSNPKFLLGKFGPKKSKLSVLYKNWQTWYLEDADFVPTLVFWDFQPKIHFWANLSQRKSKLSVLSENWHTWYLEYADFYSEITYIHFFAEFVTESEIACFVWCSFLEGADLFQGGGL